MQAIYRQLRVSNGPWEGSLRQNRGPIVQRTGIWGGEHSGEDATQSEVLIWSNEALDVDSSGYAMKVAGITPGGPFALWRRHNG